MVNTNNYLGNKKCVDKYPNLECGIDEILK